ncbi:MAG: hypothetical protein NC041_03380 [Bacteroides sp.]|nr:hypothetical protein [Prevotella sp.]MCM1408166.1 hypothetical protein [Treponema brennaborense]MCM1469490.1 hypothetical protein [Bacteroides sp.]
MKTKLAKATCIAAKILEAVCALAALGYAAAFVLSIARADAAANFAKTLALRNHGELSVQGFDINILNGDAVIAGSVAFFALAGILSFAVRTMMFRNVALILKTAAGKTSFSKGETPFQKDIVRMVREIGVFYILIPAFQIFVCATCRAVLGKIELAVHAECAIAGFVILALSQIFSYGEKLESEVEGLI